MRSDFDLPKNNIYLNTGTLARTPRVVMDRLFDYQRNYEINPTYSLIETWQKLWQVQKKVAAFFNAKPTDWFFRHNVTGAMNDFIMGVDLPAGDIAVTDLEYGAIVNICRLRCEKDGRTLHTLSLPTRNFLRTEDDVVSCLIKQLPSTTKLLMVSHIMTGSGLLIPIEKLAAETRKRGILLAVDGAHGPGALPLDFSRLENVDFYGGNLHKWMMGPKGTGFGWCPERVHSQIKPITGSWTSFDTPIGFKGFGEDQRFCQMMLMSNCLNWAPFYALADLIDYWQSRGPDKIFNRIMELRNYTENKNKTLLKWEVFSPNFAELRSPLLDLRVPLNVHRRGYEFMNSLWAKRGVTVAMPIVKGEFTVRLSSHIYSSEEEIDQALILIAEESMI